MAKKKKGTGLSLKPNSLSPENYIKTQARSLPVVQCLITEGWKEAGICNIFIVRQHKTGHVTVGLYLVDLYCLGIKDTDYYFNTDKAELDYKTARGGFEDCSYELAHNIIYGALAYAEDYGFKPPKDFAVTRFILEEDDEDVPLIELEFGLNGMPCFVQGPNDHQEKVNTVINTLKRTAGEGNYQLLMEDDLDNFDDDDFDDDDFDDDDFDDDEFDEDDQDGEEYSDDDFDTDSDEGIMSKAGEKAFKRLIKMTNKAYDADIRTPEGKMMLETATIGANYDITEEVVIHEYNKLDTPDMEKEYHKIADLLLDDDGSKAIKRLAKAIDKYPDKPLFYSMLMSAFLVEEMRYEADKLTIETYERFPDYLFAMTGMINLFIDMNKEEGIPDILNGKADLNELYPDRKVFFKGEVESFYLAMCRYYTAVDDIDSADVYMNALVNYGKQHAVIDPAYLQKITWDLCQAKIKKVAERKGLI